MTTRRRRPNGGGTIYPRKDGRYEGAAWITGSDGTRRRIRVYGHTWDETNEALNKAITEQERTSTATDQRTVAGYLEHWLTTVAPHRVRANTLTQYQQAIRQHIIPALGNRKLAKLSAKDVRAWLTASPRSAAAAHAASTRAGRPTSSAAALWMHAATWPTRLAACNTCTACCPSRSTMRCVKTCCRATSPTRSKSPPDHPAASTPSP